MARSVLAVQRIIPTGLNPTFTAANVDGHQIRSNGSTFIVVNNQDVSSMNVTVQTPGNVGGLAIAEQVVAFPAGEVRYIKFNRVHERSNRDVYVDFSSITSLTVAAISF